MTRKFVMVIALAITSLAGSFSGSTQTGADPDRVSYMLGLDRFETDLALISTAVMPGENVRIRVNASARSDRGMFRREGVFWRWQAPSEPGLARLSFEKDGEVRVVQVFVLTPFENGKQAELNGFKIGRYSSSPFRGLASYRAPRGFIDVTPDLRDLNISPNFTLEQFLCKQQPRHDPTYVLVRPAMLSKLEAVLDAVQARGHDVDTLKVMSGFRTPWYNASIGNRTTSSRHLFGGAADVFVDADGNGWMDDLNGDGEIDIADARYLAQLAEGIAHEGEREWPAGGIGIYRANAVRGPFVHIDARGYRARW